jgi:excisionase family DNA binding protein
MNKFGHRKAPADADAGHDAPGQGRKRREPRIVPLADRLSLSPEDASALTGIGLTSIREAIASGELKARKHGRLIRILPADIKDWLAAMPFTGKQLVS